VARSGEGGRGAGQTGGVRVTGVDACRGGWAGVDLDTDEDPDPTEEAGATGEAGAGRAAGGGRDAGGGRSPVRVSVRVAGSLAELLAGAAPGQVVGIDMPLGLRASGWRAADAEARRRLGVRRSSIFAIPPVAVWEQPDYQSALAVCRRLTGQGFSVQAWGLRGKLREAAGYRTHTSQRLYEVHPELSFATMAGAPLPEPKNRPAGQALRRSVLAAAGLVLTDDPAWRRATVDVLDAAAVAWTARRIATGQAVVLPDPPQTGEDGLEIAIRY
jgi:predicted RNase H-like nuclease